MFPTISLSRVEYGTSIGNKTITVDSNASFTIGSTVYYDLSYTSFYVEVISTVTPYSAPMALSEFNRMGLMTLIRILSVVLVKGMIEGGKAFSIYSKFRGINPILWRVHRR